MLLAGSSKFEDSAVANAVAVEVAEDGLEGLDAVELVYLVGGLDAFRGGKLEHVGVLALRGDQAGLEAVTFPEELVGARKLPVSLAMGEIERRRPAKEVAGQTHGRV